MYCDVEGKVAKYATIGSGVSYTLRPHLPSTNDFGHNSDRCSPRADTGVDVGPTRPGNFLRLFQD